MEINRDPQLTILLSTCDGERWLDEQLTSLVRQEFSDWKLVISDDGSNDGTLGVIGRWVDRDPRIAHSNLPPLADGRRRGPAASYLSLLGSVDTDWWAFCDQDDIWSPDKLTRTMAAAEASARSHPGAPVAVFTDASVVDRDRRPLATSAVRRRGPLAPGAVPVEAILLQNRVIGMTMLGNRPLATMAARAADSNDVEMHDWIVAILASSIGSLRYLPIASVEYRQHDANALAADPSVGGRLSRLGSRRPSSRTHHIIARAARNARAALALLQDQTPHIVREVAGAATEQRSVSRRQLIRWQQAGARMASTGAQLLLVVGGDSRKS